MRPPAEQPTALPYNWGVLDSGWEAVFCRVAESHRRMRANGKNHSLGLNVPYRCGAETRIYRPDVIAQVDDGHGDADPLNLVVEIKPRIWEYMGGVMRHHKLTALPIGGIDDHAHALFVAPSMVAPSQIAQYLKGDSSKMNELCGEKPCPIGAHEFGRSHVHARPATPPGRIFVPSARFSPKQEQNLLANVRLYCGETSKVLDLVGAYCRRSLEASAACFEMTDADDRGIRSMHDCCAAVASLRKTLEAQAAESEAAARAQDAASGLACTTRGDHPL